MNYTAKWLARILAPVLFATALLAQGPGEHSLLAGGENGGGTGVWILPACAFDVAEGVPADATMQVGNGTPFVLSNGCVRVGNDLFVVLAGVPLAVAVDYFDGSVNAGAFYDVASGTFVGWVRN